MQRTGKKELIIEDIVVREEVETQREVILYSKTQEIPMLLWETEAEGKSQVDTVDPMEPTEEHHGDRDFQEEVREDQISTQTAQ